MGALSLLESEYPGDAAWENFAVAVHSDLRFDANHDLQIFDFSDSRLTLVLDAIIGDYCSETSTFLKEWYDAKYPQVRFPPFKLGGGRTQDD